MCSKGTPWAELYRPKDIEDIVLDPCNKQIMMNIVETNYFPNLLFFGPPGTGKTTTIINLINAFQEKNKNSNKGLVIHLNASDERGIDIIRNQINSFVNSKTLFNHGLKFVILDEVDYMTKSAQQALRYLLQSYNNTVRFCLICNYISRIDEGLQNEFIRLRFNQLPQQDILRFLKNICVSENLNFSMEDLKAICNFYRSDIRSMVNFLQSNQNMDGPLSIVRNQQWVQLLSLLKNKKTIQEAACYTETISVKYNLDKKNLIKNLFNFCLRNYKEIVTTEFLDFTENLIHSLDCKDHVFVTYALLKLKTFLQV